jgi:hypothetical protein
LVGIAAELFNDFRAGGFWEMLGQNGQERVTDESQIGQQVGIAAARAVLSEEHITAPMISHFNPGPVSANEPQPLARAVLLGKRAREVIVGLGRALVGFLDAPGVAHNYQAARKGEVGLQGLDGEGVQTAGFDSSVTGFGDGKKGVSLRESNC